MHLMHTQMDWTASNGHGTYVQPWSMLHLHAFLRLLLACSLIVTVHLTPTTTPSRQICAHRPRVTYARIEDAARL